MFSVLVLPFVIPARLATVRSSPAASAPSRHQNLLMHWRRNPDGRLLARWTTCHSTDMDGSHSCDSAPVGPVNQSLEGALDYE